MSEHLISRAEAESDLLACAAYLAESIQSNDGRAQAMTAVVPRYLARGAVDLAAELANTVDDPFVRDRLLIAVAETCAETDDDEYALQLIEVMDDPGMQAQGLERIGTRLAMSGGTDKARTVAETMDHGDNVLAAIAVRQHADGRSEDALATIGEIDFPAAAAHAFVTMAAESIEKENSEQAADLLERALTPAGEIEHEEERIRSMIDIGNSFIFAKRSDRAVETFDKAREYAEVLGNVHRDNFLAAASLGFMRAGSMEFADRTLDTVADKTQIATALLGFAREYWKRDERDDAIEALEEAYAIAKSQHEKETRDSKARFSLLTNIAVQFAGFERGERAMEIAHEIEDPDAESNALGQIGRIMTVQRNDDLALTAVRSIKEDADRMFALIALSDAAAADDKEKAATDLGEAYTLAEEVPQLASRSSAYNAIARRFFDLGDADRSREVVGHNLGIIASIKDESTVASALAELSDVYENAKFEIDATDREIIQQSILRSRQ